MRRTVLVATVSVLSFGLAGVVAASAIADDHGGRDGAKTLVFDVRFSPQTIVATNNERDPNSPFSVGDEILFRDQLFQNGARVGEEVGSCVLVTVTPDVVADCSAVIRLPDGDITAQFANSPGPDPKPLALTGGTGAYRNVGGEGTLVEFGDETGTLTLRVLGFDSRRGNG
ncbi:allene oxide cyclase barrel-like domain-containing protein [Geodermatophilus sp. URMC 64]